MLPFVCERKLVKVRNCRECKVLFTANFRIGLKNGTSLRTSSPGFSWATTQQQLIGSLHKTVQDFERDPRPLVCYNSRDFANWLLIKCNCGMSSWQAHRSCLAEALKNACSTGTWKWSRSFSFRIVGMVDTILESSGYANSVMRVGHQRSSASVERACEVLSISTPWKESSSVLDLQSIGPT